MFFFLPESLPKEERLRRFSEAQAVEAAAPPRGRFSLPRLPPAIMRTKVQTLLLIRCGRARGRRRRLPRPLLLFYALPQNTLRPDFPSMLALHSAELIPLRSPAHDPTPPSPSPPCSRRSIAWSLPYNALTSILTLTMALKFGMTPKETGAFLAFVGALQMGAQAFLIKPLVSRFKENTLLLSSLGVGALGLVGWAYAPTVPLVTARFLSPRVTVARGGGPPARGGCCFDAAAGGGSGFGSARIRPLP